MSASEKTPTTAALRHIWKTVIKDGKEFPIAHVFYCWPAPPTYRVSYWDGDQIRGGVFNCDTREWVQG